MRRLLPIVSTLLCLLAACAPGAAGPGGDPSAAVDVAWPTPREAARPDLSVRLARAAAATAAAGSASTATVATVTGLAGGPGPITFRGEGGIDFAAGRSRSLLLLDAVAGAADRGVAQIETLVAGGLLYVRAPMLQSLSGAPTAWVRIGPRDGDARAAALGLSSLGDLAGSDVGAPLALLAGVDPSSVRLAGQETGGVTRLQATVDVLAAASGAGGGKDRAGLEAFLDDLGARRLQVEVDLDGDDRVRRIAYHHEVPTSNGPVGQEFEVSYSQFGSAVEIQLPPEDQVTDLAALDYGPR